MIALWLLSDSFSALCCSLFISSLQPFWFPDVGLEAPHCNFFSSTMLSLQLFTIGPFVAPDFCSAGERSPRKAYTVAEKLHTLTRNFPPACKFISSRLRVIFLPLENLSPPAREEACSKLPKCGPSVAKIIIFFYYRSSFSKLLVVYPAGCQNLTAALAPGIGAWDGWLTYIFLFLLCWLK